MQKKQWETVLPENNVIGEYFALASVAGILPISSLVDVVFYRGISPGEMG